MIPKFCYLEKIGRLARGDNENLRAAELPRLRRESDCQRMTGVGP
jgi:hypothetical protein